MSVLKQDQNAYNAYNVMDTVIMGNQRPLRHRQWEKEALYAKEEMTEADGIRACELEEEYAELGRLGGRERRQPHPPGPWAWAPSSIPTTWPPWTPLR